jgi:hypothetical protein
LLWNQFHQPLGKKAGEATKMDLPPPLRCW